MVLEKTIKVLSIKEFLVYNIGGDLMIYVIYGNQMPLIEQRVQKIVKANLDVVDDFSLLHFDMEETLLQDIIDDALTLPFVSDKKVLVVKNASIFTSEKKKEKLEHDVDSLIKYINNPAPYSILIFVINGNINERSSLIKTIKSNENCEIIKTLDVDKKEWPQVIKQLATKKEVKFDAKSLDEFINRTAGDLQRVIHELDKLSLLKQNITLDIVESMVARPLEENMFGMVDAILDNKPGLAMSIYNDLRTQNEDPARLVPALANQFRFLYKVGYLVEQGYNDQEIASELNVTNTYRIVFSKKKLGRRRCDDILKILSELAELDYKIKTGQIDRFQGFELFIVSNH